VTDGPATHALETRGLTRRFGGFTAVDQVSLVVKRGARHALIGPNGAGKTTFVNLLSGAIGATAGEVLLEGRSITGLSQAARARAGLSRTFQVNQLFAEFSPEESVVLAILEREGKGTTWWRPVPWHRAAAREAGELLGRLGFDAADRGRATRSLPYGRQRLLEIALALAARPRVLLLDEPAAGVPPSESRDVLDAVAALPRDVAVLLIEHDMDLVFRFAERITVLAGGRVLADGTPEVVARDQAVREAYLGEAEQDEAAHG